MIERFSLQHHDATLLLASLFPLGAVGLAVFVGALVAGAATPAIVNGSPIVAVGLVGFVAWLAIVMTSSIALLRSGATPVGAS